MVSRVPCSFSSSSLRPTLLILVYIKGVAKLNRWKMICTIKISRCGTGRGGRGPPPPNCRFRCPRCFGSRVHSIKSVHRLLFWECILASPKMTSEFFILEHPTPAHPGTDTPAEGLVEGYAPIAHHGQKNLGGILSIFEFPSCFCFVL